MRHQMSFVDGMRLRLDEAIQLSLDSLRSYGQTYRHWAVAYSGGKDSTATATFVAWAIREGLVPPPDSLTVLYADTRMELPPLQLNAMNLLADFQSQGFESRVVLPEMDKRFLVYMLGYGVPPPSNTFRWCTRQIKVDAMMAELSKLHANHGKLLILTGVRQGESAARDRRIAVSCSRDSGECGQGWFQVSTPDSIADTLAPLLHWRVCHVYDWLYFDPYDHGYDVPGIADVYGQSDVRTGCIGCPLVSRDVALERLLADNNWSHLAPLRELRQLWHDLKTRPGFRKRKIKPVRRQDGTWSRNAQRKGPLTMDARAHGLQAVLDIQQRANVDLVDEEEAFRIREMWRLDMWPRKWSSNDARDDTPLPAAFTVTKKGELVRQDFLVGIQ